MVNTILGGVIAKLTEQGIFRYIDEERGNMEKAAGQVVKIIRSKSKRDRARALEILKSRPRQKDILPTLKKCGRCSFDHKPANRI